MGWQDISTAPKDGWIILYSRETGEMVIASHMTAIEDGEQSWVFARGQNVLGLAISFVFNDPTHWMPLPPPPTTEGAG